MFNFGKSGINFPSSASIMEVCRACSQPDPPANYWCMCCDTIVCVYMCIWTNLVCVQIYRHIAGNFRGVQLFWDMQQQVCEIIISIPYSGKFLRGPIFGVIANDRLTTKIKYKLDCTVHNGHEYAHPRNGRDRPSTKA